MSQAENLAPMAYTIAEFCRAHSMSRWTFYELKKRKQAPRVMRFGAKRLIAIEEAQRWRKAHTESAEV